MNTPQESLMPKQKPPVVVEKNFKLFILFSIVSVINGLLYIVVAKAGGQNIEDFLNISQKSNADTIVNIIAFSSAPCYTMFFYKTLENLKIRPNNRIEFFLSALAPVSAASFLTAGIEGAQDFHITYELSLIIGMALFMFRTINCADGAAKITSRCEEILSAFTHAKEKKDFKELTRIFLTIIASVGYSISSTDPIFSASQRILGWLQISSSDAINIVSYMMSIIGAIGIFPMSFYWIHRGLKQLTYGGTLNKDGQTPDPTDKFTYLALIPVAPVTLGVLGSAVASTNHVFGKLGMFAEATRISSSFIYSMCAGVPGISTLLRVSFFSCSKKIKEFTPATKPNHYVKLEDKDTENETEDSSDYESIKSN